ncbi:MAG: hypothetical protein KIC66_00550 [Clostridium sp.]|nr:hypothetical protein [Clostridium sp.]MBS5925560.1 hypothetical protein [Clostridium sp.]MBS5986205.1 hypothetical protein [Clostridium sp.]
MFANSIKLDESCQDRDRKIPVIMVVEAMKEILLLLEFLQYKLYNV